MAWVPSAFVKALCRDDTRTPQRLLLRLLAAATLKPQPQATQACQQPVHCPSVSRLPRDTLPSLHLLSKFLFSPAAVSPAKAFTSWEAARQQRVADILFDTTPLGEEQGTP